MKLRNTIILTLPEFRRKFKTTSLFDFWKVRHQFIREMDWKRERVSYWDERDMIAFNTFKDWIEKEDKELASVDDRKEGIAALRQLSKSEIDMSDEEFMLQINGGSTDDIIYARDERLRLPAFNNPINREMQERIHKIEVADTLDCTVSIYIGEENVASLEPGECVYVTEIGGKYVRNLPAIKEMGNIKYELKNVPGQYRSILKTSRIGAPHICYEYPERITHFWFNRGDLCHSDSEFLTYQL